MQAQNAEAPYIYYYSHVLKGVVVERADGTDSRIIGKDLVQSNSLPFVVGPGWSQDGTWFAWSFRGGYDVGTGHVVNVSDQQSVEIFELMPCVNRMLWHPTDNILLIQGKIQFSGEQCGNSIVPIATYWLVDVDTQTLLATYNSSEFEGSYSTIFWQDDGTIQFAERDIDNALYLVTMHGNGHVEKIPTSDEEIAEAKSAGQTISMLEEEQQTNFNSSHIPQSITLPQNTQAAGGIVAAQQSPDGEWFFLGYEFCYAGCANVVGYINIFSSDSEQNREIAACGDHPTCVDWLPESVDHSLLPEGQSESVLTEQTSN
jgi:hypothetical protein